MRIAVIGGGFTGLTAAYELAKKGHNVTLFERSKDLGGLASGIPFNGTFIEKGYHHLFTTDSHILSLAREVGIGDLLIERKSSIAICHKYTLYPFTGPMDLIRCTPLSIISRFRMGFVLLYLQLQGRWKQFVNVSADAWMRRWCGNEAYEFMWKPLLIGKFHHYYQTISMAWLWGRLHLRAQTRTKGNQGELLVYIRGGFQSLIDAIVRALKAHNVDIRTSAPIEHIRRDAGTGKFHIRTEQGDEAFDRCICTTPSSVMAALIEGDPLATPEYLQKLRSIDYIGALCMIVSSTQSLSKYYWTNILDLDSPFLAFIQHSNLVGTDLYQNEHVYYLGVYIPHDHDQFTMDEAALKALYFGHLKKMFPAFDESAITSTHILKLKNAQHIMDCDYEHKVPDYKTPVPGLYLANFSQLFPDDRGTNFSVREGRKIVDICLGDGL